MQLEVWQWLLAVLGAILIGLAKTGLPGLGILSVAVFAMLMPAKQASGVVLPMLIFADLVAVAAYWRHAQWGHLLRLFPWTGGGVVLGWLAMSRIDDRQAQVMVGAIILALLALHFGRRWLERRAREAAGLEAAPEADDLPARHGVWFAPTLGVLAGFTTLVSNAAGPLMTIYLVAMGMPKLKFIGTAAVFFFLLNCFKVPFMANLDLVNGDSFLFNMLLAPAVLLGAFWGKWLLPRMNQKLFELLVLGLSVVAGLRLIWVF